MRGSSFAPTASALELVSTEALERAICAALDRSGVAPADVAFVEAFGSGVPASDRAEIAAIARPRETYSIELRVVAFILGKGKNRLIAARTKTDTGLRSECIEP